MRRKFLIALLALGTVGGFASGFASLRHCQSQRRDAFEQHVAQVCVDAARKSDVAQARAADARAPQAQPGPYAAPVVVNVIPGAAQPQVVTIPAQAAQPAPVAPVAPAATP